MMGIDIGITNTKLASMRGGRIKKALITKTRKGVLRKLLKFVDDEPVALTGAYARREGRGARKAVFIDEMASIGVGGASLAGLKKCIVASVGTGTAIVAVDGKRCEHLGGTGIGGGTITGLGERILRIGDCEGVCSLAEGGKAGKVDITVGDVYGKGIGIIPGYATASNFAKAGKAGKADIARGIVGLVGESVGVLACFAARGRGLRHVVFTGTAAAMPSVRESLLRTTQVFGLSATVPERAPFATAFGAGLLSE